MARRGSLPAFLTRRNAPLPASRSWLMEHLYGLLERHAVSDGLQMSVAEEAQEAQGQAVPLSPGRPFSSLQQPLL